MRKTISFVLTVLLVWAPVAAAVPADTQKKNSDISKIGQRDINKGSWNLYSIEKEMEMGAELAAEAERSVVLLRDPVVVDYIRDLADRIVRNSDARVPAQVRVVDSDELNAFALPGGHFFINTGLILEAQTEAELTSIIAHEIAHVAARHATKQRTKANIWNWVSIPLLIFGGPVAYSVYQGAAIAVPLTFLKFSRNAEKEADFLGLQYHYKAGYDPVAFVDFFERLKRLENEGDEGGIAGIFSTHPMTRDRIKMAEEIIGKYLPEREEYVVTTSRFDQVRAHLRRLLGVRTRNARQGEEPVLRDRTGNRRPDNFRPRGHF